MFHLPHNFPLLSAFAAFAFITVAPEITVGQSQPRSASVTISGYNSKMGIHIPSENVQNVPFGEEFAISQDSPGDWQLTIQSCSADILVQKTTVEIGTGNDDPVIGPWQNVGGQAGFSGYSETDLQVVDDLNDPTDNPVSYKESFKVQFQRLPPPSPLPSTSPSGNGGGNNPSPPALPPLPSPIQGTTSGSSDCCGSPTPDPTKILQELTETSFTDAPALPRFEYSIPFGFAQDPSLGFRSFGELKVSKEVSGTGPVALTLADFTYSPGSAPLQYGPHQVGTGEALELFWFTGDFWFRIHRRLPGRIWVEVFPSAAFQPDFQAFSPLPTQAPIYRHIFSFGGDPSISESSTVRITSQDMSIPGPSGSSVDEFSAALSPGGSITTWILDNASQGWEDTYVTADERPSDQNGGIDHTMVFEHREFRIDTTGQHIETLLNRQSWAVYAADTSVPPNANWNSWVPVSRALISTENGVNGAIQRRVYRYPTTDWRYQEQIYRVPIPIAPHSSTPHPWHLGVDVYQDDSLIARELNATEIGAHWNVPVQVDPWLDGIENSTSLNPYVIESYTMPDTPDIEYDIDENSARVLDISQNFGSQSERRFRFNGQQTATIERTSREHLSFWNSANPGATPFPRHRAYLIRHHNVLARPNSERLEIELMHLDAPKFSNHWRQLPGSNIPQSEPVWVETETFLKADQSGNVTEHWPETNQGFDPDNYALPATNAPYKMSSTVEHALAGGPLYEALDGIIAPSGGAASSNYVSGKTLRTVSFAGKHGTSLELTQVWNNNTWATLTQKRSFYLPDGKLDRVEQDGITLSSYSYPDPQTEITTNADGQVETRVSNSEGQTVTTTRSGAPALPSIGAEPQLDQVTTFSESETKIAGQRHKVSQQVLQAGALSQKQVTTSNLAGTAVSTTDQAGITTNQLTTGLETRTNSPGGISVVQSRYLDGKPKSIAGSGTIPQTHTYSVTDSGIQETISTTVNGATRSTMRVTAGDGETLSETSGGVTTTYSYDLAGRMTKRSVTGLAPYLLKYDFRGVVTSEGYDMNQDGMLTPASTDLIVERDEIYEQLQGAWWRVTTQTQYVTDNDSTLKRTTVTRERQGIGPNQNLTTTDPDNVTTTYTRTVDRSAKTVTEVTTSTKHPSRSATRFHYNGLLVASTDFESDTATFHRYDALGRLTTTIDPRHGMSSATTYDPATGQVVATTNPSAEVTRYGYYGAFEANAGRLKWISNPSGEFTFYAYNSRGQMTHQWGSGTYPIKYGYNDFGDQTTLTTYHTANIAHWSSTSLPGGFNTNSGASITTWTYDPSTGKLLAKIDSSGQRTDYAWNSAGLLQYREWSRLAPNQSRLRTTYTFDATGRLEQTTYNDATPPVTITYDRSGRQKTRTDAAGTHTFTHPSTSDITEQEIVAGGILSGLTLSRRVDPVGRAAGDAWQLGSTPSQQTTHAYDLQSRLQSLSIAGVSASYQYQDQTPSVTGLTRPLAPSPGAPPAAIEGTFSRDAAGRLRATNWQRRNTPRGTEYYGSLTYHYDAAGRRSQATDLQNISWHYGYNSRGEITSANKLTASGSPLTGWSHGYGYDDIGNRTQTVTPEAETLASTANTLNQIASRQTSQKRWLRGRAHPLAEVKINGTTTSREGQHWQFLLSAAGSSSQLRSQEYSVLAERPDLDPVRSEEADRMVTFPQTTVTLTHDADGNLNSDGQWQYEWDAENRLIAMEEAPLHSISSSGFSYSFAQARRLEFAYDALGRRIRKRSLFSSRDSQGLRTGPWLLQQETVFVWQDWRLLSEYVRLLNTSAPLQLRRSYLWGMDLVSGVYNTQMAENPASLNQAGGVGGLVWVVEYVPGQTTSHRQLAPWYDGNGNIMGWVENDASQVLPLHRLEYDPFGRLLIDDPARNAVTKKQRDLGTWSAWLDRPPFGFSTKYEDTETGLLYYGYRHYSPQLGRWLSRDPIEEVGGLNLYSFLNCDPVNHSDFLGLQIVVVAFARDQPATNTLPLATGENRLRFTIRTQMGYLKDVLKECGRLGFPELERLELRESLVGTLSPTFDALAQLGDRNNRQTFGRPMPEATWVNLDQQIRWPPDAKFRVLITGQWDSRTGLNGFARANSVILLPTSPAVRTLPHEIGHVINWLDEKTGDTHSSEPNNLMNRSWARTVDCQWCKKFKAYVQ